jgi:hypothetical protein
MSDHDKGDKDINGYRHVQDIALEVVGIGGGALLISCLNWAGYAAGAILIALGVGNYWARKRGGPLIRINRHGVTRA